MSDPAGPAEVQRPSLLSSGLLTYGATVGAAALSLLNVFIVARTLGPVGRGDVALLTTIAFLTTQAATFGVDQATINFAGRDPRLAPSLASTAVLLAALFGAAGAGLVLALVALVPGVGGSADPALLGLVLAAVPPLVLYVFLNRLCAAFYGFRIVNLATLTPAALNVVANGALAVSGVLSVAAAISIWVAGQLLSLALVLWFVLRRLHGFGRPRLDLARRMCSFGIKAHAGRIMLLGNYRLDQWVLGGISGSRELGLYSVAVAWSEVLFFLPNALMAVQRPDLVRADSAQAAEQAARLFRTALFITAVLAVALVLLAPVLCVTIFGDEFAGSVTQLRILTLGGLGIAALKMLGDALTAQGRPLLETAAVGVAFVTIVLLDVLLIPAHGGVGAAVAASAAYSAGGIAVAVIFARALGGQARDLVPRPADVIWLVGRIRRALRTRFG